MICDKLELYESEFKEGYDFYCMLVDEVADPNDCIACPYLLDEDKKDSYRLKKMNEGFKEFDVS